MQPVYERARAVLSIACVEPLNVRPARRTDADAVASLLYASAGGMYDRFAGGRGRALQLLRRAFETPGNSASAEVVQVVEVDRGVAAALAAFPVEETTSRASAFLRLALRAIPPWRWPRTLWLYWAGARAAPNPPHNSLYVDALATDPGLRRRGAAKALLDEAERKARRLGRPAVALDTSLDNSGARSLYLESGFEEMAYRAPGRGLPGFVALVKELG
jgi:ribosomal protein S18 acetylase RimI-like enzyme